MKPIRCATFLSFLILAVVLSVSQAQATNVSGSIAPGTIWTLAGSPYIVTGNITVPALVTLTIQPGVEVRFNQWTGMWVDGTLQAAGTSNATITFTGATATPGWWYGIFVRNAGTAVLELCTIRYAGYSNTAGLEKTGTGGLTLRNSIIGNTSGSGLRIASGYSSFTSEANTFENNTTGVHLLINASFDDNTSIFSGNGNNVYVNGGTITGNSIWNLKKDYSLFISGDITVGAAGTLTVKPGTVVKFGQYVGMWIDGLLDAQGTSAAPIYFTDWRDDLVGGDVNGDSPDETPPTPNWWRAIYVRNAGSAEMTWCTIRYGGYYDSVGLYKTGTGDLSMTECTVSNTNGNGMAVVNSSGQTVLAQSTFSDNTGSGLYMNSGPTTATNCTFSNNTGYGIFQEVNDSLVYTGNTFIDNTAGGVGVNGGTMTGNITWQAAGSPFRVTGDIFVDAGKTLTLEPGVEVRFNQYRGIFVDGTLQAVGTSALPITFTGTEEAADWWRAIYIRGVGAAVMEWCTIEYGGYYEDAGILKIGTGSLSLKNSSISYTGGDGLRIAAGYSAFTSAGNSFQNNNYGIRLGINTSFDDNTSDFSANNVNVYVDGGDITGAVVWNLKKDYSLFISGNITVGAGGVLTVKPGTVVKFGQYFGIWIDGQLDAQGTSAAPIYFTDWRDDLVGGDVNGDNPETPPSPNWWRAIFVRSAGSAEMTWCTIRYGGYYDSVGLYKTGSGDLSMTDCTVSNTNGNGMAVVSSSGETVLAQSTFSDNTGSGLYMNSGPTTATNCTFSNNAGYGIFQEVNDSLVYTGNTFTGNTAGGVGVNGGNINENITWQAAGSPFRVTGDIFVAAGKTLTIEPGMEVQFNQYRGMWIDGNLQAIGTSEAPITFTGTSENAGWWRAIYVRSAGNASIERCTIGYGGYYDYAGILKTGAGALSLKNSIISHINGDGLRIGAGYSAFTSADNSFQNNNYGVRLGINTSFDDNTSDFSGNNVDVYVDGGTITGETTWNLKPDYSLFISNDITVGTGGTLTVKPGTVVKFEQYRGMWIDGLLDAQGTSAAPIFFTDWRDDEAGGDANNNSTGNSPSPYWWRAIYVRNAGSAEMTWCTIRYSGYYDSVGLYKSGSGDLNMTRCTISYINGNGLQINNSTGDHTISRNTFTLNPTGVYILNQPDTVTISGNLIEANTSWGMFSQGSAQVDATGNWWGDETGPWHATINPDGQGDKVSGDVLLEPWRTSPSTAEILAPTRSGTLVQGDSLRFMGALVEDAGAGYAWDFGDGRTSSDRSPGVVKFPEDITYEVHFRAVLNGQADPYSDTRTFTVESASGTYPDLQVVGVTIPGNLAIGQPAAIGYTAQNPGDGAIVAGSWKDAVYFSDDPYLDSGDALLGSALVQSDLAVGASYQGTINVSLPATGEGARYLILSLNDEWQFVERQRLNNEKATAVNVLIPTLVNDLSQDIDYDAGRVEQYYRMTAESGQNLVLTFDQAAGLDVYVRYGGLPTRSAYDFRLSGDQLSIPAATTGEWFVMVYGNASQAGQYTIGYSMTDLSLSGVSPATFTTLADAQLTLTGAGFISPLTVELIGDGGPYAANSVEVDSFTQAIATFSAGSVPAGTYTVKISHGGKSDELASAVEIIEGGTAKLETRLILPFAFGYHGLATVYVEYSNTGNASMPAPLLLVTAFQNNTNPGGIKNGAIMTLDATRLSQGFWTSALPEGFSNSVQFLASGDTPGILQPGESRRVPVYYAGWQQPWDIPAYPPFEWNVGVLDADNDTPVNWADFKDGMRPDYIRADAWDIVWNNFISQAGTTWGHYVGMLSRNATYLNRLGQRVDDINVLLSLSFRQADAMSPLPILAVGSDMVVQAPGLPLTFERIYMQPISRRFELGAFGRGWTHNWQYAMTVQDEQKTVVITDMTGTPRIFQKDSRYENAYLAQPGDLGVMRAAGSGTYTLTEKDGLIKAFGADGNLAYVQDPNGNRIDFQYTAGFLAQMTHSSGQSITLTYAGGFITRLGENNGRQTNYTYEGEYLASVETSDGLTTSYSYSSGDPAAAEHALVQIDLPDQTSRIFTYDNNGRLASIEQSGGANRYAFSYGEAGKISVTDPLNKSTQFFLDSFGRIVKTQNALDETIQNTYNEMGRLAAIIDAGGHSYTFDYDRSGNLIRMTDAMRQSSKFTYSRKFNRMTSAVDSGGNKMTYKYDDDHGNLIEIQYPDGSSDARTYDANGNLESRTNRRDVAIGYTYDEAGRIKEKAYADGTKSTYAYDAHGNMTLARNATSEIEFTYDNETDYLTQIDYPDGRSLSFTYDAAGRRESSTDQLGYELNYHYDALGRLSYITDKTDSEIVRYDYDAAGRISKKTTGNDVYVVYAYDDAGRLQSLVNYTPSDAVISRFVYTYDNRGRRVAMETHYGTWTYTYDDRGQLTRALLESTDSIIADQDISYDYDAKGNRTRVDDVNGTSEAYASNNLNQYTSAGDNKTYTYDLDGNLIQENGPDGVTVYTYNDENQLVGMTRGADQWEYGYDALGNQVVMDRNGSVTHYLIDPAGPGSVEAEYVNGALIARYAHGLGLINRSTTAGVNYYAFDAMGNTSELTDGSGASMGRYAYAPYGGMLLPEPAASNPFKFMGEQSVLTDIGGHLFTRARAYDPELGRFMQVDPIGQRGGINLYRYALNAPVNRFDPMGLCPSEPGGFMMWARNMFDTIFWEAMPAPPGAGEAINVIEAAPDMYDTLDRVTQDNYEAEESLGFKLYPNIVSRKDGIYKDSYRQKKGFCGHSKKPAKKPTPPTGAGGKGGSGNAFSSDPNQKLTNSGFGSANYVSGDTLVSYRIDFENLETATAPAKFVTVRDALSPYLNLETVELLEVGFGNVIIPIAPGLDYFDDVVDYVYVDGDYDFSIKVRVEVWVEDGKVCANFTSLDSALYEQYPDQGLPPEDAMVGFLMPENDTGRGKGYVSFAVKPKADVPSGGEIRNIATIQFDGSLKINTNQDDPMDPLSINPDKEALITFDTAAPTSAVSALPAQIHTPFTISWSGTDDGAGIAGFDVYVKVNEGPWVLMKNNTTETSAGYYGNVGNTYRFYSVAIDNLGNRETAPVQADTSTVVIAYQNGDVNGDDGVNLADAILVAKILANVDTGDAVITLDADVNEDGQIGIAEMIYILQRVAGLR